MMMTSPSPNRRAALLSGLRTGGVRSVSTPLGQIPYTAAPAGQFDIAASMSSRQPISSKEEHSSNGPYDQPRLPKSAGSAAPLQSHSRAQTASTTKMNANTPAFVPGGLQRLRAASSAVESQKAAVAQAQVQAQAQAQQAQARAEVEARAKAQAQAQAQYQAKLRAENEARQIQQAQQQMAAQIMQINILKAQQQAQLMALAGQDVQTQQAAYMAELVRQQMAIQVPASAGPATNSFGFGVAEDTYGRATGIDSPSLPHDQSMSISAFTNDRQGGRSPFGTSNARQVPTLDLPGTPTKSDSQVNWRRGGNNNSVLSGNRSAFIAALNSPTVRVTPPPIEEGHETITAHKTRPRPLQLDESEEVTTASSVTGSSPQSVDAALSSPDTSSHSFGVTGEGRSSPPMTAREEISKKLYASLARKAPFDDSASQHMEATTRSAANVTPPPSGSQGKASSIPVRQPRGPPAAADELGPRNFASRVRRKAIGGLGVLMTARERRSSFTEVN